jgi:hypothetical protein
MLCKDESSYESLGWVRLAKLYISHPRSTILTMALPKPMRPRMTNMTITIG